HLARATPVQAAAHGAIGVITVRTIAQAGRGPFSKTATVARTPRRSFIGADGKADAEQGAVRFTATLDDAAAAKLFDGAAESFAAVRATAEAGAPRGFALAGTVRLDRSNAVTRISSPNVLARLPGSNPALTDQLVLMTAHLDHLGMREGSGDTIYNGALDNAAGVATVLSVARSFAAERKAPKRSLLFLVTTGEEGGLMGASYFARHPTVAIDRIVAEVNIDMPLLTCDFADIVAYGADRSTMGPLVAAAALKQGLQLSPDPQPVEALFTRSDHYPLVRAGIPAVFVKAGWRDTAGGMTCRDADKNFRSTHYHEPSDDLSRPIDWNIAVKFARINAEIARTIANNREAPRWYAGDYFGDAFAPAAPKAVR
ncbi:MAG: M20/M25/M40 family metallo-hydrolase, partial [Polymorphobacter sp.]